MKKEDVPQQFGLNAGCQEINYAVGNDGRYTLIQSAGWEVKTIALGQAWEAIADQLQQVIAEIQAGKKSSLAYYMVKNQMDPALLSQYSGVARWRVKRHLKPAIFNQLDAVALTPYVELFDITIDQLRIVPEISDLLLTDFDRTETHIP